MKKYSVSVIIPIFRGRNQINRLINMLRNSAYESEKLERLEVIFVNDDSNEKLDDLTIKLDEKDFRYKVIDDGIHRGIHGARVKGLEDSTEDYIMFLDQDDIIDKRYFKTQLDSLLENDIVLSNGYWHNRQPIYGDNYLQEDALNKEWAIRNLPRVISPGQVIMKKEAIPDFWCQNILVHNGNDDNYLWLLMIGNNCKTTINKHLVYTHCENGGNASHNWVEMRESKEEALKNICASGLFSNEECNVLKKTIGLYVSKYCLYQEYDELFRKISESHIELRKITDIYAIYGMGIYGKKLWDFMENEGIHVKYGIDLDFNTASERYKVVGVQDRLDPVDIIIVSSAFAFDRIEKELKKITNARIVRMDVWLRSLMNGDQL